jgi:hypothetical protein
MSTHVIVTALPPCDICKIDEGREREARYDGKVQGITSWANMCPEHFAARGVGLGTGVGQLLYTADEDPDAIRAALIQSGAVKADEAEAGRRWTTEELREEFDALGFAAPFIVVRRKSDGVKGSLEFTHNPRIYFNFKED